MDIREDKYHLGLTFPTLQKAADVFQSKELKTYRPLIIIGMIVLVIAMWYVFEDATKMYINHQ